MAQSRMVVNDDYEHPDHLEYILESVLMPSDESLDFNLLRNDYNSVLLHKCQCDKGGCANNERCSHGDPSRRGNIGRYINHSCDPNCHITAVRIDCPIPKICVFAARSILAQEELCFHYGGEDRYVEDQASDSKACLCSADSCAGFMPNSKII
ncbi:histone-lysine N-methyltransferase SETMAR isoform X5 [Drosophila pseudoobscura]|uniref:Histone-lysine N-methyltransferase SETMAR isoform X5 n=1 Tax=Drosophila pseudoobscura pseudoobscura TaxID=46245 RepID=A0A6I8VPQ0_DROPS|nr:histone-lysine N-methyltransferase SETMAR isoform X5 [Drosophila pseudoobscura]